MNNQVSQSVKQMRGNIAGLQAVIGQFEQVNFEPKHHFSEGLYARELLLEAGSVVVGKIHKHAHLNVILYGKCRVSTPFGTEELEGPMIFESKPDTKRAVYAIEDTLWITFHPTEETDVAKIEADIILDDYSDNLALTEGGVK